MKYILHFSILFMVTRIMAAYGDCLLRFLPSFSQLFWRYRICIIDQNKCTLNKLTRKKFTKSKIILCLTSSLGSVITHAKFQGVPDIGTWQTHSQTFFIFKIFLSSNLMSLSHFLEWKRWRTILFCNLNLSLAVMCPQLKLAGDDDDAYQAPHFVFICRNWESTWKGSSVA